MFEPFIELFGLFSKWFGIIALFVAVLKAIVIKIRLIKFTKNNPTQRKNYNKLFWGYLIYTSLPWLIMSYGILVGGIPTIWHYLTPNSGNLYVLAFYLVTIVLWILDFVWIMFGQGAKFLANYWYSLSKRTLAIEKSTRLIKIKCIFRLLGEIMAIIVIWIMEPTTIRFIEILDSLF